MTRSAADGIACWVLKTAALPEAVAPGWSPGEARVLDRCLRASYRLGLTRPGAPRLLWVSGRDRSGVHAVGTLAGDPRKEPAEVAVRFVLPDRHVPRAEPYGAGSRR